MSAANEWDVDLKTRREISYMQAAMYHFIYHINTIAPHWQEKSTSLMNEIKWSTIVCALKMKTCVELLQRQTMGLFFNIETCQ